MTTHFQKLLKSQIDNPLFSGRGDDIRDGRSYFANGFDCFLAKAANAVAADGIDRKAVARMFVAHALEVLDKTPGATPADSRGHAAFILQEALRIHSLYDDPEQAAC